ncbi:unnamed protein product [Mytilus coruscus]|uniref:Uncharacterized protein n=1 Tax=Mytilus coruscus TaxID=42192 RepID=A0A6J8A9X2_MYTCO|nr:unnamed protein product [Mytilus coruscus]
MALTYSSFAQINWPAPAPAPEPVDEPAPEPAVVPAPAPAPESVVVPTLEPEAALQPDQPNALDGTFDIGHRNADNQPEPMDTCLARYQTCFSWCQHQGLCIPLDTNCLATCAGVWFGESVSTTTSSSSLHPSASSIAFLSSMHIRDTFIKLRERANTPRQIQELVAYVNRQWFNNAVINVADWCIFKKTGRTNNDICPISQWHNRINTEAKYAGVPLYVLVPDLRTEAEVVDYNVRADDLERDIHRKYTILEQKIYIA